MLKSSSIFLSGLRFHAFHGVLEQERVVGNDYSLDVRLGCSVAKALETDCVDDTVNYAEVYEVIAQEMAKPSKLLERVVGRIASRLFSEFPEVEQITISMTKQNPPMGADCKGAGVEMHFEKCKNVEM